MTPIELYGCIAAHVFRRAEIEEWQADTLFVLARFLDIPREQSIDVVRLARQRAGATEAPFTAEATLAGFIEWAVTTEDRRAAIGSVAIDAGRLLGVADDRTRVLLGPLATDPLEQAAAAHGFDLASLLIVTDPPAQERVASPAPAPTAEPVPPDPAEALAREERGLTDAVAQAERLGGHPPRLAMTLFNLAKFYRKVGRLHQARNLFERSLAIRAQVFGPEHPIVAQCMLTYAELLEEMNRPEEAHPMQARARQILSRRAEPRVRRKIKNDTARAQVSLARIQDRLTFDAARIDRARQKLSLLVGALPPAEGHSDLRFQLDAAQFQAVRDGYVVLAGRLQVIGTYLEDHGAWLWGWMNPEVPANATDRTYESLKSDPLLGDLVECSMFQIEAAAARRLADWVALRVGSQAAFPHKKGSAIVYLALEAGT